MKSVLNNMFFLFSLKAIDTINQIVIKKTFELQVRYWPDTLINFSSIYFELYSGAGQKPTVCNPFIFQHVLDIAIQAMLYVGHLKRTLGASSTVPYVQW